MLIGKNKLIARRASADTIKLSFNSRCGPRGGIPDTRCGIISRSPFGAGCATFIVVGHGSRGCWTAPFQIERAEDQPAFNQVGLSGDWALGARVLAFGPAFSVGVDNGHEPRRTCDPHRSRHYETALSSSESDDVACQGA